jgi:hypothetical protein
MPVLGYLFVFLISLHYSNDKKQMTGGRISVEAAGIKPSAGGCGFARARY